MGGIEIDASMWKDILDDCDDNNDGKVNNSFLYKKIPYRYQRMNLVIFFSKLWIKT